MRDYPTKDYELKELADLNAEPWMIEALKMNPDYNSWGNGEDYMSTGEHGWGSAIEIESVNELFGLDELNELVNFHFEIVRNSITCESCDGSGYNEATKKLSDDWYSFDEAEWIWVSDNRRYNNKAWSHHLTEVEVKALAREGRLGKHLMGKQVYFDKNTNEWLKLEDGKWVSCEEPEYPSPIDVNASYLEGLGHDSINHFICVKARAEHLGVYGHCDKCNGKGYIYTEPKAHLALQLWYLHPRKGASRGVLLNNVEKENLNIAIQHLKDGAERNAQRFSKVKLLEEQ